ncbi:tyrosine-type recombinase/integrase [Modestobacter sp. VKM Ac-2978]|uniref:tyrosine-type recombinase/integrase n=1 Tax=Modestobacter sp. VKM Ac-2978 TaxID=3004132 RepID=UPI0022AAC353|nr:site-specific integrase [Modestobacter sp. VKM Ac-2978]MCZ2849707.1 site-specific integrase [Modestobacter sp. VKM Ac-2978]
MAKRANGEGSVFRRSDGRWSGEVSYRDEYGTMKRRTVYGRTQTEVRSKMKVLRERLDAGAPVKDTTMSLSAWLEDWSTKALPASDRKQATIDLYATIARKHLVPALGTRPLDRIRPSDVEALIVFKRRAGLAPSTVRTIYTVLRAALDIAVRDGLLGRNPAAAVRRPAVERQDAAFLTVDDAHRLLDSMRGERLEPLFRLMLATGLRRGEALGLHWSDVDLDGGTLRVRWTLTRTSKGLQLGEPKTEKSRRSVPLPRSTVTALRAHRRQQATEQLAAGEAWRDSDLLFTTEVGTPLEPRNVLRRFETLAERAGLRDVHLHTLRHSAASFLLAAGTHTKVVQEHLGHSSYAITADIYSHVAPEQRREAADRLDEALEW